MKRAEPAAELYYVEVDCSIYKQKALLKGAQYDRPAGLHMLPGHKPAPAPPPGDAVVWRFDVHQTKHKPN